MDNINFNTFYTVTKNHLVEQLKQEKIEKRREQIIKLKSQNAALVMKRNVITTAQILFIVFTIALMIFAQFANMDNLIFTPVSLENNITIYHIVLFSLTIVGLILVKMSTKTNAKISAMVSKLNEILNEEVI